MTLPLAKSKNYKKYLDSICLSDNAHVYKQTNHSQPILFHTDYYFTEMNKRKRCVFDNEFNEDGVIFSQNIDLSFFDNPIVSKT